MTDAQRDRAAELKAVIAEMREVVRLRKLFGEQEASLALWADRLSALAEAAPGPDLHGQIMNLPCLIPTFQNSRCKPSEESAYRIGHRDARHAAAELVASPPLAPEPIEKSIYARACENDPLVKQAEQVVGALAPERAEDRRDGVTDEQRLAFFDSYSAEQVADAISGWDDTHPAKLFVRWVAFADPAINAAIAAKDPK